MTTQMSLNVRPSFNVPAGDITGFSGLCAGRKPAVHKQPETPANRQFEAYSNNWQNN